MLQTEDMEAPLPSSHTIASPMESVNMDSPTRSRSPSPTHHQGMYAPSPTTPSPRSHSPVPSPSPRNQSPIPPPSPTSPDTTGNHLTSPDEPTGPSAGGSGRKMPQIKIKKQYSKIFRIKTKILQNLGKADKTTDEVFDEYEHNFNKQQAHANRLQKEVANYLKCCRALHGASKGLFECLSEVFEPEWVGHDLLYVQAQNSDMLWTDFCHKVQDQTLAPLTAYQLQFPEVRKKIEKRGRKLVDYDSQRHQLENLQRSGRPDEYKIARSKDELEKAKETYETLNKELYGELPELYDHRIGAVANHVQTLCAADATFLAESSKIAIELEAIADKLGKENSKGTYRTKRGVPVAPRPLSAVTPTTPTQSPSMWYAAADEEQEQHHNTIQEEQPELIVPFTNNINSNDEPPPPLSAPPSPPTSSPPPDDNNYNNDDNDNLHSPTHENNRPTISAPVSHPKEEIGRPYEDIEFEDKKVNGSAATEPASPVAQTNGDMIGTKTPLGATTEGLPGGVLYRVRATYKYTREDVDEISFEVGEIMQVVEYEDPEEQEEGWLCGIKETTNEKGLFPANFTRPI